MILLDLNECEAEMVISALFSKIDDLRTDNIILKNKVEKLTEQLNCSEIPNSSESEVDDNG